MFEFLKSLLFSAHSTNLGGNNAQFVSQSGIPAKMQPSQRATVSITMKNTGTTTWTRASEYKLGSQNPQDNTFWTGNPRIYLNSSEAIAPGQQKTFTFDIIAPNKPGTHMFQWRMVQDLVEWFGGFTPNVRITVAVPVQANGAQYVSQSVPTPMRPGERRSVSITIKNTGTTTWTRAGEYKLGSQNPQDNTFWTGSPRIYLNSSEAIAPGQQKTFTFDITAPPTPGIHDFQWRMVQDLVEWFGGFTPNVRISVAAPAQVNSAQCLSQDVPDQLRPGERRMVSITMKNTGTTTWIQAGGYKLGSQNPQGNAFWTGSPRVYLSPSDAIAPGQQKTFSFEITAPNLPGIHDFQWGMVQEGVEWFGGFTPNVQITVAVPVQVNGARFVSQDVPHQMRAGESRSVSVTMENTGTTTWTQAGEYKLGSQNPQDNTFWTGSPRIYLDASDAIAPGQQKTFTFDIIALDGIAPDQQKTSTFENTAPDTPRTRDFQWRMVQDGVEWFGEFTPNMRISVSEQVVRAQYRYHRIVCSYPRYDVDRPADSLHYGNIRFPEYGYPKDVNGQVVWYARSQATQEYGNRTRDLCIEYGIEAISGWWEPQDSGPLKNFDNAFGSIDLEGLRIIYMFGVNVFPGTQALVLAKVREWAEVMADRKRYAYITNANGASCPILMIWGLIENESAAAVFKEMIMGTSSAPGVRQIIQQKTGATPFIIMSQHNALSAPLLEDVITSVDAFYQHEIAIPAEGKIISTAEAVDGTRQMFETAIDNLAGKKSAATGLPVYFIPGAMPQFNRKKVPQDDHGTVEARSRSEVQRMFELVRSYAPTIWTEGPADQPIEHKWVTITSLNEWPEGQTIEPSRVRSKPPQFPNPVKYQPPECDYGYDFLELVRDVFN